MVCQALKDHILTRWDKKKQSLHRLNDNFLCFSCPSAAFALQHGGFVTRDWFATNDLYRPGKSLLPFLFLCIARPSPPSFFRVLRPVNHDAMLLGWSLPEMDEFGRSNNLTVKGYKASKAGCLCL